MLSKKQLEDICLAYPAWNPNNPNNPAAANWTVAKSCRYLSNASGGYVCLKHKKSSKKKIDDSVNQFIQLSVKKKIDPYDEDTPLGDNCKGYPILKNIQQGYDQP